MNTEAHICDANAEPNSPLYSFNHGFLCKLDYQVKLKINTQELPKEEGKAESNSSANTYTNSSTKKSEPLPEGSPYVKQ